MGMFDTFSLQNPHYLYINFFNNKDIPISYEEFTLLDWQTKDGECILGLYKLSTDGRLTYKSGINKDKNLEDYAILNRSFEIHSYDKNKNRYSCVINISQGILSSLSQITFTPYEKFKFSKLSSL